MKRPGFIVAALLSAAVSAQAAETLQVSTEALNVRSGPGTGYAVIGEIHLGQTYVGISTSGSWKKIWYGPGTGWVYSAYVTSTGGARAKVTTGTLNVRSGPGTDYDIVGAAGGESWWTPIESSGAWQKIWFAGALRWVHGGYLSTNLSNPEALPTSSANFVQLPASGSGYYCYSVPDRRWGTPALVYGFMDAASDWDADHDWPALGVGDLSLKYGGPISGHVSHQVGKGMDVLPVRNDTTGSTTIYKSTYSHERTKTLLTQYIKTHLDVKVIFFNDPAIYNPLSYVQYWDNHDNHFHVRIY